MTAEAPTPCCALASRSDAAELAAALRTEGFRPTLRAHSDITERALYRHFRECLKLGGPRTIAPDVAAVADEPPAPVVPVVLPPVALVPTSERERVAAVVGLIEARQLTPAMLRKLARAWGVTPQAVRTAVNLAGAQLEADRGSPNVRRARSIAELESIRDVAREAEDFASALRAQAEINKIESLIPQGAPTVQITAASPDAGDAAAVVGRIVAVCATCTTCSAAVAAELRAVYSERAALAGLAGLDAQPARQGGLN